jgi:hypothetical protein
LRQVVVLHGDSLEGCHCSKQRGMKLALTSAVDWRVFTGLASWEPRRIGLTWPLTHIPSVQSCSRRKRRRKSAGPNSQVRRNLGPVAGPGLVSSPLRSPFSVTLVGNATQQHHWVRATVAAQVAVFQFGNHTAPVGGVMEDEQSQPGLRGFSRVEIQPLISSASWGMLATPGPVLALNRVRR